MNKLNTPYVFFLGIGGIGMSAMARYFLVKGRSVMGYDKTPSGITEKLTQEGALVVYDDQWNEAFEALTPENCLVVYTPAIPKNATLMLEFHKRAFSMVKRAETLGMVTRFEKSIGVAGTHGKSTTSAMLAFLLSETPHKCNAFLGAIATNFDSNYLFSDKAEFTVMEADEFDRSFLFLAPFAGIVTSVDPDHLDIYETADKFHEGFRQYAMKIDPRGVLVVREGIALPGLCKKVSYALESTTADYVGINLVERAQGISFTLKTPKGVFNDIHIGIHGQHNAENAVAALALCAELGLELSSFIPHFSRFQGIKRRFEMVYQSDNLVFIDDYAHHPTEISRLIESVKAMFPNLPIAGVFQPHLFSRTKDFAQGFAEALAGLDQLFLLPIYPARELPISGIDSPWLLSKIRMEKKQCVTPAALMPLLRDFNQGVLLTLGAGDIDRLVPAVKELLIANENE